jgi:hypothetical protein
VPLFSFHKEESGVCNLYCPSPHKVYLLQQILYLLISGHCQRCLTVMLLLCVNGRATLLTKAASNMVAIISPILPA